jgi:hypothetical protein
MSRIFFLLLFFLLIQTPQLVYSCGPYPDHIRTYYSLEPPNDFRTILQQFINPPGPKDKAMDFLSYKNEITELLNKKEINNTNLNIHELDYYYRYYYGSACMTNHYSTALSFIKIVAADCLEDEGIKSIVQLRHDILTICSRERGIEKKFKNIIHRIEKLNKKQLCGDYPIYLKAIAHFYNKDYLTAIELFKKLEKSSSSWLSETSNYMVARTYLIYAQKDFDGIYSKQYSVIKKDYLEKARDVYFSYLKKYPNGLYLNSTKNIKRRIFVLAGENGKLDQSLKDRFKILTDSSDPAIYNFLLEFKRFFGGNIHIEKDSPLLIAYDLLDRSGKAIDSLEKLEKHKKKFLKYNGLYTLMRISFLYNNEKFTDIIKELDNFKINGTQISTITGYFLAKSYIFTGKYPEGRRLLKEIKKIFNEETLELQIARSFLDEKNYSGLAEQNSGVNDESILIDIFRHVTTDDDLKSIILSSSSSKNARIFASRVLFNRFIFEKRYKEFISLYKKAKKNIDPKYQTIYTAIRLLNKNSDNPKGLLNMGYFLKVYEIRPAAYFKPSKLFKKNDLIIHPRNITDDINSPFDYFKKVISHYNDSNDRDMDEAKALRNAILCFKVNKTIGRPYCTWSRGEKGDNQGRIWFLRLHKKYPDSQWAKETKYWH